MSSPIPARWAPYLMSLLRMVVAFLFVTHGTQKFFGVPGAGAHATVPVESMPGAASIIEMIGGVLMFLGLFTRSIAFLLAGEMAVAYFMVHAPRAFFPLVNRGEPAVFYCFTWLYYAAAGGGPWSLDALARHASDERRADVGPQARRTYNVPASSRA